MNLKRCRLVDPVDCRFRHCTVKKIMVPIHWQLGVIIYFFEERVYNILKLGSQMVSKISKYMSYQFENWFQHFFYEESAEYMFKKDKFHSKLYLIVLNCSIKEVFIWCDVCGTVNQLKNVISNKLKWVPTLVVTSVIKWK